MKILIDCDVLLDVGLGREPFCNISGELPDYLESNPGIGFIAWHSVSNFFYIAAKAKSRHEAKAFISDLCQFIQIPPTSDKDVSVALHLPMNDFEDALQCSAALLCGASFIVTRNIADYQNAPVRVVTPEQILSIIKSTFENQD